MDHDLWIHQTHWTLNNNKNKLHLASLKLKQKSRPQTNKKIDLLFHTQYQLNNCQYSFFKVKQKQLEFF